MNSLSIATTANAVRLAGKTAPPRQRSRVPVPGRFVGTSSSLRRSLTLGAGARRRASLVVNAEGSSSVDVVSPDVESDAVPDVAPIGAAEGYVKLAKCLDAIKDLPPSERAEAAENATGTVRSVAVGDSPATLTAEAASASSAAAPLAAEA